MGWIQKLRKKAQHDTPEAILADVERTKAQLQRDINAAMEGAQRRFGGLVARMKAMREAHGVSDNDGEYHELEAGIARAVAKVRGAFDSTHDPELN